MKQTRRMSPLRFSWILAILTWSYWEEMTLILLYPVASDNGTQQHEIDDSDDFKDSFIDDSISFN